MSFWAERSGALFKAARSKLESQPQQDARLTSTLRRELTLRIRQPSAWHTDATGHDVRRGYCYLSPLPLRRNNLFSRIMLLKCSFCAGVTTHQSTSTPFMLLVSTGVPNISLNHWLGPQSLMQFLIKSGGTL